MLLGERRVVDDLVRPELLEHRRVADLRLGHRYSPISTWVRWGVTRKLIRCWRSKAAIDAAASSGVSYARAIAAMSAWAVAWSSTTSTVPFTDTQSCPSLTTSEMRGSRMRFVGQHRPTLLLMTIVSPTSRYQTRTWRGPAVGIDRAHDDVPMGHPEELEDLGGQRRGRRRDGGFGHDAMVRERPRRPSACAGVGPTDQAPAPAFATRAWTRRFFGASSRVGAGAARAAGWPAAAGPPVRATACRGGSPGRTSTPSERSMMSSRRVSMPSATSSAPIRRPNETNASTSACLASPALVADAPDDLAVDLDDRRPQGGDEGEARVAGTGVVHREAEAELAHLLDVLGQARRIRDVHLLGALEGDLAAAEAVGRDARRRTAAAEKFGLSRLAGVKLIA